MKNTIQHFIIKSTILVLLLAVVFPSFIKFAHVFEDHKHEVCINPSESHFHEIEIDCEFYKFNLNENKLLVFYNYDVETLASTYSLNSQYYISFYNNQQLITFLRGPPLLV